MHTAVVVFALVHLVTMGLSHILAPKTWAELFVALREQGRRGVFAVGFMSLYFGSIIVAFHNVWTWPGIVLTLLGWAQVIKAFLYFTFPQHGLRGLARVSIENNRMFVWAGLGLLAIAALVALPLLSP